MKSFAVRSLVCHRDIETALFCLPSLDVNSEIPLEFVLHDDGTLTEEDRFRLVEFLPGSRIVTAREADEVMHERLKNYPHAAAFRARNVLARKLLDVAVMCNGPLYFSDSDVLYLRPFTGLFGEGGATFSMGEMEAYSVRPWHLLGKEGVTLPSRLNSGVMAVREYDLDFVNHFLGRPSLQQTFAAMPWWAEQTAWAALGAHLRCRFWSPKNVAVMEPGLRISKSLVAIHFVTNIRYRLREFLGQRIPDPKPVAIRSVPSKPLTPWMLTRTQLRLRLERLRNDWRR